MIFVRSLHAAVGGAASWAYKHALNDMVAGTWSLCIGTATTKKGLHA